jgi:hypothetical protein
MSNDIIETTAVKVVDKRGNYSATSQSQDESPQVDLVLIALQNKYDPAIIEKLMDLSERNQKNIARQAYYDAMAQFKAEAPPVKKDKYNKRYDSYYTSLGNLLDTYNPVLGRYGLSATFPSDSEKVTDNKIIFTCRISHKLGYYEDTTIPLPIDKGAIGKESGQKSRTDMQDIKSTFTYGRSLTFEAALGVAGTEASIDNDGNGSGNISETITEAQIKELQQIIDDKNIDTVKFFKWAKVEKIEDILAKSYDLVLKTAKKAKGRAKTKPCPEHEGRDVPIKDCETCQAYKAGKCASWS